MTFYRTNLLPINLNSFFFHFLFFFAVYFVESKSHLMLISHADFFFSFQRITKYWLIFCSALERVTHALNILAYLRGWIYAGQIPASTLTWWSENLEDSKVYKGKKSMERVNRRKHSVEGLLKNIRSEKTNQFPNFEVRWWMWWW